MHYLIEHINQYRPRWARQTAKASGPYHVAYQDRSSQQLSYLIDLLIRKLKRFHFKTC